MPMKQTTEGSILRAAYVLNQMLGEAETVLYAVGWQELVTTETAISKLKSPLGITIIARNKHSVSRDRWQKNTTLSIPIQYLIYAMAKPHTCGGQS